MAKQKKTSRPKRFNPTNSLLTPLRAAHFMMLFTIVGVSYLIFSQAATIAGFYGSVEQDQVNRINSTRAANGIGGVNHIECLNSVAEQWTQRMANNGSISHNPNLASDVANLCGNSLDRITENVGLGWDSASLFNAFMGSASHKANILDKAVIKVGVGAYHSSDGRLWVTQVFAHCLDCSGNWGNSASLPSDPVNTAPQPVAVTGRVFNPSTGGGFANVTIETCTGYNPKTDANGNWYFTPAINSNFCARVQMAAPSGTMGPTLNNNPERITMPSYEWQVAGAACYQNSKYCGNGKIGTNNEVVAWDRNLDSGYDFRFTNTDTSPQAPERLSAGQSLTANQKIESKSREYQLVMQPDGNLVIYRNDMTVMWQSKTAGAGNSSKVFMQSDGNLVLYKGTGGYCHSSTYGKGGTVLIMQDDGNAVMYNASNKVIWSVRYGGWYC